MCCLRWLIALALRTDNITGARCLEQVIQTTRTRPNKTIHWTHPNRPVLCKFSAAGTLELDAPAASKQLGETITYAGQWAGILGRVTSHDERRGSFFDLSQLK